jgi:hypothetical protein
MSCSMSTLRCQRGNAHRKDHRTRQLARVHSTPFNQLTSPSRILTQGYHTFYVVYTIVALVAVYSGAGWDVS